MKITFIPLAEYHLTLLLKWLEMPHIKIWWDPDIKWTSKLVEEKYGRYVKGYKLKNDTRKPLHAYIIYADDIPIGYIQIYNTYDFWGLKPMDGLPSKLAGFDMFIGEKDYLKRGIGTRAINQFLEDYCNTSYTHIFADPHPKNIAAIRTYEKAGFRKIEKPPETEGVWMLRENLKRSSSIPIISIKTAPHFTWGNSCDGYWLKKYGPFTVISEMMPPGTSEKKHYHEKTEQFFYVLEGVLMLELNEKKYTLKKDEAIVIHPDNWHKAFNNSNKDVRFLVVSYPNSHKDRIDLAE